MGSEFWESKRVLVTGADGFIGSHLTEKLVQLGASVSVLVRGTSVIGTGRHNFARIPERVTSRLKQIVCCDIASADTVNLVVETDPQIIFHLAAVAYVPFSFDHPLEVMAVNVIGTLHVLEAAKRIDGLKRIVCTSSSEVYGTALTKQIDETHPLNPTSPYAASKVAADRYCYSYHMTYGLPVSIVRPFNTYGPRHTYDVIPKFIRLALRDNPITIYGAGGQTRDFMYVEDTVEAFLIMGSHADAIGRTINFGTGREISVLDVAHLIRDISGSQSEIVHIDSRVAEVDRLCCQPTLASNLFGWDTKVDINQGLARNISWARDNL